MPAYYDLAAANERVRELRPLLTALRDDRYAIVAIRARLEQPEADDGTDGEVGQTRLEQLEADHAANGEQAQARRERERDRLADIVRRMERTVRQIDAWGISLRDIGTGLVDFPALASGRPIWLCWKLGEDEIAFWHELDAGIAGRKPLIELE